FFRPGLRVLPRRSHRGAQALPGATRLEDESIPPYPRGDEEARVQGEALRVVRGANRCLTPYPGISQPPHRMTPSSTTNGTIGRRGSTTPTAPMTCWKSFLA